MYSKKFLYNSVFNTPFVRPNLNVSANVKSACTDQCLAKCFCMIRSFSMSEIGSKMNNAVTNARVLCRNGNIYEILAQQLRTMPSKFKDQSTTIIRAWTRQCEYIVAQRFRRTQQMICLYTRMWEERALRELLQRMRQQMTRRSKDLVLGAMGITAFNWDTQRISDDEISEHMKEFDYVCLLQQKTIICDKCCQRRLVDIMLPDMTYCKCANNPNEIYSLDEWVPFLERKDLIVWRRAHNNNSNYEYKLYGTYDDVTAEDFLQVQINTEYRQQWDTTAIKLFVVDTDKASNSDIIYWEMQWPRMFSNRDYVYNRRYAVNEETKVITIVSRSTEHPACPVRADKHRVSDYQSCMVIRPCTEMDKPGIEFTLTYFDDPGVNIPAAVTSWVAIAGMPDFLTKLRIAAKAYREQKASNEPSVPERTENPTVPLVTLLPQAEETVHPTANVPPEQDSRSYWRYIHPYYYLG